MPSGSPKFETAEVLQAKIDEYLETNTKRTISGLCLFLGFESRQSFYDYEERPDFSYTIKRARLHLEVYYEENLLSINVGGAIFALKNLGWKDKSEVETFNRNYNAELSPEKLKEISDKLDGEY